MRRKQGYKASGCKDLDHVIIDGNRPFCGNGEAPETKGYKGYLCLMSLARLAIFIRVPQNVSHVYSLQNQIPMPSHVRPALVSWRSAEPEVV